MRKKKSWKCLMALALSVTMLVPSQAAYATEGQAEGEGVETYAAGRAADADGFEIEDGVLKKYTGTATEVVIPDEVTSIGSYAFNGCASLRTVSIPEGITRIPDHGFQSCSALMNVRLPEGLESIGTCAFYDCNSLKEITIPEGVTSIDSAAFSGCSSLMEITIPEGVEGLGNAMFRDCSSLTEISIPKRVMSIGSGVFKGCNSLATIKVEEGNAVYDSRADCNAVIETESGTLIVGCKNTVIPEGVAGIGHAAFSGCNGLTGINIPEGVTKIDYYAFVGCSRLTEISIPEEVISIGSTAFSGCSDELTIYGKTGSYAEIYAKENDIKFSSTGTALNPIEKKTISSNNVTLSQNSYTYDGRAKKPTVTIKDGNTVLKEGTDYTVTYSNNINVGTAKVTVTGKGNYTGTVTKEFMITKAAPEQGVKDLSHCTVTLSKSSYTYDGKAKKPAVTVKDGNTALKERTDYTVTYSNNINVGTAKVTVAGKGNYKGTVTKGFTITVKKGTYHKVGSCQYKVTGTSTVSFTGVKDNKAAKVKIPKTVKIGGKDFKVTAIGSRAFKNNKKIASVEIGDNVKSIGTSAFEGCTKLSRATLGKGIIEIGGKTFKNCKKLGTITIKSTKLKKVGKNSLKGIKPTAKIKVPAKKLPAYKKLFKNKGQGRKVKVLKQ